MDNYQLAVITGAAHRLGRAFALRLASNGYAVLLHYNRSKIDAEETESQLRELKIPVFMIQADLTNQADIEAVFSYIDSLPHELRVLVNSAAIMTRSSLDDLTISEWDTTLSLNLRAPFLMGKFAAGRMGNGGLIINITESGVWKTWTKYPAYQVSKAALETLTRVMARTYAPKIRVNAIAPGLVLPGDDANPEEWKQLVSRTPLKRSVTVEEVASALDVLLENSAITGQTLVIDGGFSLIG
ncbi:MAG: SDR family oxidoreductase [Chloroflexota bacterium]